MEELYNFNTKKINTILIIINILIAFILVFMMTFALKDYNQCSSNPFTYAAKKIFSEDNGGIRCTCSFGNPKYEPFYFDKSNVTTQSRLFTP